MRRSTRHDGLLPLAPWSVALANVRGLQRTTGEAGDSLMARQLGFHEPKVRTMKDKLQAVTAAINAVTAARTAVDKLPILAVLTADQQADLDEGAASFGAAASSLATADRHLRVARALLAFAQAEPAKVGMEQC